MRFFTQLFSVIFFISLPPFSALAADEFKVLQFREMRYEQAPALKVRFSAPVEVTELEWNVRLTKGEKQASEPHEWILADDNTSLVFPFVDPNTFYKLFISSSVSSEDGQTLDFDYVKTLKTKYLPPSASFADNGFILSNIGDKSLPITSVNVDKIDIDFFRVNTEDYHQFFNSRVKYGQNSSYRLNKLKNFSELVHSSRFELDGKENQRINNNIDLSEIESLKQAGLYIAVLTQAGVYSTSPHIAYFTISDLALQARKLKDKFAIHTMDLVSGKSQPDVELTIYNREGKDVTSGLTDEKGWAELAFNNFSYQLLVATKGDNISILPLNKGALDLSDFKNAITPHSDIQVYSYGPRDLYKPGETVEVQLLVRDADGRQLDDVPVRAKIKRPDGVIAASLTLQPQEAGYYKIDYETSSGDKTGTWTVEYQIAGMSALHKYQFKLEDFKPQRLTLDLFDGFTEVNNKKYIFDASSTIRTPVSARFLFGAPAANNKVDALAAISFERHPFTQYENYYFGDPKERLRYRSQRVSKIRLDKNGKGKLSLRNRWSSVKSPITIDYTASLYEASGQPVVEKDSITLLSGNIFLGVKPLFSGEVDKNTNAAFSLVVLDKEQNPIADEDIQLSLIREDRNYYWTYTNSGRWTFKYDASPYESWSSQVRSNDNGKANINVPIEFGHYRLVATTKTGQVKSSFSFTTSGRWWANSDQAINKPETILMSFDKTSYQPGTSAELTFVSPHDGLALVSIENSEGMLLQQQLQAEEGENKLQLELANDWSRHDYYATVTVISKGQKRRVSPKRAFGVVHVPVKRDNTELDITLQVPATTLPNKPVAVTAQINAHKGNFDTYVTFALVDVGILNISKYATPTPQNYFWSPRRYQVDFYDVYDKIIETSKGKLLRQQFGGDFARSKAKVTRGGKRPNMESDLLSFLSDPIKVDVNGTATTSFNLPDFSGELKWVAVAFNQSQVGSGDAYTKVFSPITTQVSTSSFLTPEDKSQIVVELHNVTESNQELELSIKTSQGLVESRSIKKVSIDKKSKQAFFVDITAKEAINDGIVDVQVSADADGEPFNYQKTLHIPLRPAYPAITEKQTFKIEQNTPWLPEEVWQGLMPSSLESQLTLSNLPPIDFASHFTYLLRYPYGCLEQTTSSAMPWLYVNQTLVDDFALQDRIKTRFKQNYSEQLKRTALDKAVKRLQQKQRADGSFALWGNQGREESWLTVYATEFLFEAIEQGVDVPNDMYIPALKRLSRYVKDKRNVAVSPWLDSAEDYQLAVRAYAAFVLAKANRVSIGDIRRIVKSVSNFKTMPSLAAAHTGVALQILGDKTGAKEALSTLKDELYIPKRYSGYYTSYVRDTAWILNLAKQYKFDVDADLFDLQAEVNRKRYMSTQERGQMLKLFNLLQLDNKDKSLTAQINTTGKTVNIDGEGDYSSVFGIDALTSIKSILADDTIYGSLTTVGYPASAPPIYQDQIEVSKRYLDLEGSKVNLRNVSTGEVILVELKARALNQNIPDAMVVDLLPAGFVIENQNLGLSSVSLDQFKIDDEAPSQPKLEHQEFRLDRYVAAIRLRKNRQETIYYVVRAVIPGEYKVPPLYAEDMFKPEIYGLSEEFRLIINKTDD